MGFSEQQSCFDRRRGFFLFGSFSFFKTGCGNVENSTGRPALATNMHPDHSMVTRRHSSRPKSGEGMHAQMLSFEDSAIRDAVFPVRSEEEETNERGRSVAWIGIDWADEVHEVWEYTVQTDSKRHAMRSSIARNRCRTG